MYTGTPMTIIAICAQKGGCGKTTLALSLAVAADQAGFTTAVIDLDPQATASVWADRRRHQPPVVVSAQAARLPAVLETARAQDVQIVIIDTPPRAEQAALAAAKAATRILIPCRPAIFDLDTLAATLELIALASHVPVAAVLTHVPPQGQETAQARAALATLGLPVCPVSIGHRKAFPHAAALGLTPSEYDPLGKAAAEIAAVAHWMTGRPIGPSTGAQDATTAGMHA